MDAHLSRLQDTLRTIEQGRRLENVDGVLLRQVLGPSPKHVKRERTAAEDAHVVTREERGDVYRALVELQRQRKKTRQLADIKRAAVVDVEDVKAVNKSPPKPSPMRPDRHHPQVSSSLDKQDDLRAVSIAKQLLDAGIQRSQQELHTSQLHVAHAVTKVEQALAASASLLPLSFLFERNLASYCQARAVDAVKRVLLRCQHRFFLAYWHRWSSAVARLRFVEKQRAVATISRVFRGFQARKLARTLRRQRDKLEFQRLQLERLRVQYREAQARRIQRGWRRFRRRKLLAERLKRREAAKFIQKRFRDRRLRANTLIHALVHSKTIQAAIRIQKMERGRQARGRVTRMKRQLQREALVADIISRNASTEALVAWKLRRRGAAFLITREWIYPFVVRRRFEGMADQLKRLKAAGVVGRVVRRWWTTKRVPEHRNDLGDGGLARLAALDKWLALLPLDKQIERRQAAVLIQKNLRRWVQQGKYIVDKATREKRARRARLAAKKQMMEATRTSGIASLRRQLSSQPRMASTKVTTASITPAPRFMKLARSVQPKDKGNGSSSRLKTASTASTTAPMTPEDRASSVIQRSFRRHKAQVQVQRLKWRSQACQVEKKAENRRRGATRIQSTWRAWTARRLAVIKRAERVLRAYIRRWKLRRSTVRACAALRIASWYHNVRGRHLALVWRLEHKRRVSAALRLQRWVRHCVWAYRLLPRVLAAARRRQEASDFGSASLDICRRHLRESLLSRSVKTGLESAVKKFVGQLQGQSLSQQTLSLTWRKYRVVELPVVQLVFLAVGTGAQYTQSQWIELSKSASGLSTLLQTRVERSKALQFFKNLNRTKTNSKSNSSPKRSPGKKALLFSPTDVDVCLAKATGASKGALAFPEFVKLLGYMAELKITPPMTDNTAISRLDEPTCRLLTLLWRFVLADIDAKPLLADFQRQIDAEVDARARCLQRLARRRANLMRLTMARANAERKRRSIKENAAAAKIQTLARRVLATRTYKERVQEAYDKYVDPDWGLPYWVNPRTGYSTWTKPAVLGAEDVKSELVPFPSVVLTLKVPCSGKDECDRCAQWLCYDCEEFFCLECLPEFHKTKRESVSRPGSTASMVVESASSTAINAEGPEREHEMEKLALCGLCAFQLASRRCSDCENPSKKPKTSAHDRDELNKQALFCDVCFAFLHRRGQLQTHKAAPLLELCQFCVPDALEQAQSVTSTSQAVKQPNAVQWECNACLQARVCGVCALQSHPIESCGELRRLPLQTPSMLAHLKRLKAEQEARDRADVDKQRQRVEDARRDRFARVLQRFWLRHGPLLRARRVLLARRQEQSGRWRQQFSDLKREKTLAFRVQQVVGSAPVLPSDSEAQKRLRGLNAVVRRRMRRRARAFGVLLHEYMTVGVPLPGVATLVKGDAEGGEEDELATSEDLRGWVKRRQTLRLVEIPKDTEKADKYLLGWSVLAQWKRWKTEKGEEVVVDVAQEETAVSERSIKLASRFPVLEENEDGVEVVLFLVEFSMDPKRTVWIDHTLAERLWEWKRLKGLQGRERREALRVKREAEAKKEETVAASLADVQAGAAILLGSSGSGGGGSGVMYPPSSLLPLEYSGVRDGVSNYDDGYQYGVGYGGEWSGERTEAGSAMVDSANYYYDASNYNYTDYYRGAGTTYDATGGDTEGYAAATMAASGGDYYDSSDGHTGGAYSSFWGGEGAGGDPYDTSGYYTTAVDYATDSNGSPACYEHAPVAVDYSRSVTTSGYTGGHYEEQQEPTWRWEEVFDPQSSQSYYYNRETGETSWDRPAT